jgi:hypothetical protein
MDEVNTFTCPHTPWQLWTLIFILSYLNMSIFGGVKSMQIALVQSVTFCKPSIAIAFD